MTQLTIREARRRRKMTQDDLAAKSGVDQTTISSIEVGRRRLTDDIKARLAKALGIAPARLRFSEPDAESVAAPRDRTGHDESTEVAS